MQKADEPLRKITLNLYDEDIDVLKRKYGWGWSEVVRRWVRQMLNKEGHSNYDKH